MLHNSKSSSALTCGRFTAGRPNPQQNRKKPQELRSFPLISPLPLVGFAGLLWLVIFGIGVAYLCPALRHMAGSLREMLP